MELFFQRLGTGANATRRCSDVVITHGFLGSSNNWNTVGQKLLANPLIADRVRHAYALDMRDHGRSPHSDNQFSNALMSSDVEKFIANHVLPTPPSGGVTGSAAEDTSGNHILIGHSMGGGVVMNTLYRRWNEDRVRDASRSAAAGLPDPQDNIGAMDLVPEATLHGNMWDFGIPSSSSTSSSGGKNRIAAAVIVDIMPTDKRPTTFDSVDVDLRAMKALDLSKVQSVKDGMGILEQLGVQSSQMRNFLLTNLLREGGSDKFRWRCNLNALVLEKILSTYHPLIDRSAVGLPPLELEPCPIPVLFVFGEKSPYYKQRDSVRWPIRDYFSNAEDVVIPGAGHFVHYEKMDPFVEAVAPFLYEHMGI